MIFKEIINNNHNSLKNNPYPGRGIITGKTPISNKAVQIYWIMGRSISSRNRFFKLEKNNFVKTEIFNKSKLKPNEDTSLIVYYPIKEINNCHIISNGDQTENIFNNININKTFEQALDDRLYEPDQPNFTPRISGIIDLNDKKYSYKLSAIKSTYNNKDYCYRCFYNYTKFIKGIGHCITTYKGDDNPLPSYEGEPFLVELFENIDDNLKFYWNLLNTDNKVAILIKYIDLETKEIEIKIINKNK